MADRCAQKFLICEKCGNIVGMIKDTGTPIVCCGEPMKELVANTVDASLEKHVPAVEVNGDVVEVNIGVEDHPMVPEHFIEWVYIKTEKGGQRKCLNPEEKPHVSFTLNGDKLLTVFAYCNIHGLWKKEM